MPDSPAFETLGQLTILRDPVLGVREDLIRGSSGILHRRKVVEYRRASAVLPMREDGQVLLIRHYRHPVGRDLWEIPGGAIEDAETPSDAAARELREETGYTAGKLDYLLRFHPEPAFCDHEITLFVGTALESEPLLVHRDDEITAARFFSEGDARQLVASGQAASSWTVIALIMGLAHVHGNDT